MRRFSVIVAGIAFFALAGVGAVCGASPLSCALRAVAGAAVLYVLARVAGRVFVGIIVDAIVRGAGRPGQTPKR
jgi:hypothetical protein